MEIPSGGSDSFSPRHDGGAALLPAPGGRGTRAVAAGSAQRVRWGLAAPPAFSRSRVQRVAAALCCRAPREAPDGQPAPRRRGPRPTGTQTTGFLGGGSRNRGAADWTPGPRRPTGLAGRAAAVARTILPRLAHHSVSIRESPLSPSLPQIESPRLRTPRRGPRQPDLKVRPATCPGARRGQPPGTRGSPWSPLCWEKWGRGGGAEGTEFGGCQKGTSCVPSPPQNILPVAFCLPESFSSSSFP